MSLWDCISGYYAEFNLERQAPRKPDDSAEEAFAAVVTLFLTGGSEMFFRLPR